MRKLLVCLSLVPSIALLAACPKKKADADAAADAAVGVEEAAAPPPPTAEAPDTGPPPPAAKNSAQVARFPGETPIADDDLKLANMAIVWTQPRGGQQVAVLRAGTDVVKLAEYQSSIVVTFPDPKDASSTLMGWIGKEAFVVWVVRDAGVRVVPDAGPPPLKCAGGQEAVVLAANLPPSCRKKCASDADCRGGQAGSCIVAATTRGKATKVCQN